MCSERQRIRDHTGTTQAAQLATSTVGDDHVAVRHSVTLRAVEDYTNKYKGEQVEVALFGGEYQEGVLTAYCSFEDVPHVELNGHILIPLQNVASLHCSSRCDAPEPDGLRAVSSRTTQGTRSPWREQSRFNILKALAAGLS